VVAALFALAQFASAGNAPAVSGTYQVKQKTNLGPQTQVRMRIHLVNHGPKSLAIQRVTLWDFFHRDKGGTHVCALTFRAHASAETTQQFTIRRPDWPSQTPTYFFTGLPTVGRALRAETEPLGLCATS